MNYKNIMYGPAQQWKQSQTNTKTSLHAPQTRWPRDEKRQRGAGEDRHVKQGWMQMECRADPASDEASLLHYL